MLLSKCRLSNNRLDNFLLSKQTLGNFYLDGPIYGSSGELIDHSTPVQVVNAAYDTSGNGGRKLVRLSNGWLIAAAYDNSSNYIHYYKSINNGQSFTELGYNVLGANIIGLALTSIGTSVYAFFTIGGSSYSLTFNATTASGNLNSSLVNILTENACGTCSITTDGTNLYATWSSKNATYPNSFNVRSAKSVDGGSTWTKQDGSAGVDQQTTDNTVDINSTNSTIACMSNGKPIIVWARGGAGTNWKIAGARYTTWWSGFQIYDIGSTSYTQSSPCAVVAPNGRIWVGWHGIDATDTPYYHPMVSYSDDNGATWSGATKLTSGKTTAYGYVSMTVDKDNNAYAVYQDDSNGGIVYKKFTTSWGAQQNIHTGNMYLRPSACSNYTNFTLPMVIYYLNSTSVWFAGVWTA
jgi:hypothetical protein